MNTTQGSSKLIQDLVSLEKDFRYNLQLLKIRDSEIQRCNASVRKLEDIARTNLAQIAESRNTAESLQLKLRKSEQERSYEKQIHERRAAEMTENLEEMKRNQQKLIDECDNKIRRTTVELERRHAGVLIEKKQLYFDETSRIQGQLQTTQAQMIKMKAQLESVVDENLQFRETMRQKESQYVTESSIYKNELKTSHENNASLKLEIEYLRNSFRSCERETQELRRGKFAHQEQLQEKNVEIKQIIKESLNASEELKLKVAECGEMRRDIEQMKNLLQMDGFCNVQEHEKFEDVQKQNGVLQEVVKAMRKERAEIISRCSVDDTEKRVEQLEATLKALKEQMMENINDCD